MTTWNQASRFLVVLFIGVLSVGCGIASAQSTAPLEFNKKIVRQLIVAGYNQRDRDVIDRLQADTYVSHENSVTSRDGIWHEIETNLAKVPDFHLEITDMIAEDDRVVSLVEYTGTHANFNTEVAIRGVYVHRLEEGKIAESWIVYDLLGTALHCGFTLTPPPQAASEGGK